MQDTKALSNSVASERPAAMRCHLDLQASMLMVLFCLALGFQQVAIKIVATDISPLAQVALRSSLAALLGATPPESLADLHQEALTYLDRYVQWLALQLEFVETGVNAIIIESNAMIEEINVREFLLSNEIIDVKYIYNFG